jgi:FkbM family methyltransferase
VLGSGQSADLATGLRKGLWRLLRTPFDVPWLDGLQVRLYPGNETCRSLFVTGRYEPNEICLLARILKPGMVVIDAGANLGLYALLASGRVGAGGKVLAIEPSSRELEMLRKNIELNDLTNIKAVQLALSDQTSEGDLLVAAPRHSGHNTLGAFIYGTALDHRERVKLERLDDIVRREELARVDLIKMDIEGAEYAALRGGLETLKKFHPVLLLELCERALQQQGGNAREVVSMLKQLAYRIYGFDRGTGLPAALSPGTGDSENIVAVAGETPW